MRSITSHCGRLIFLLLTIALPIISLCQATLQRDSTWGYLGRVVTQIGTGYGTAIKEQTDGKIIVGGNALIRYNIAGNLDSSFNQIGIVTNPFGVYNDIIYGIAIQPDEKIVVAGYSNLTIGKRFAVARYMPNGRPDSTFGVSGIVNSIFPMEGVAKCVVIQPDNKIIVGGGLKDSSTGAICKVAITRFKQDGSLDSTFHTNGMMIDSISNYNLQASGIALMPNGNFVVAVSYELFLNDFTVAMYKPNGDKDSTFDDDGVVKTRPFSRSGLCTSVVVQPDGKIIGAGAISGAFSSASAALRYKADGKVDSSFASNGTYSTGGFGDYATSVALQTDGKIVIGGTGAAGFSPSLWMDVTRLNPNGTTDASGKWNYSNSQQGWALQIGQNRIYITGSMYSGGQYFYFTGAFLLNTGIVPLHLTSFNAVLVQKHVLLKWQTANEINTSHFNMQRRLDGREFTNVGKVLAKGNVASGFYSFAEDIGSINCNHCHLYYRLQMVDKDGKFTYSNIVTVSLPSSANGFTIYPNPATNFIQIQFGKAVTGKVDVEITDMNGKVVMKKAVNAEGETISLSNKLTPGTYMVSAICNQEKSVQKLVITQ